jgi:hypothetical protein
VGDSFSALLGVRVALLVLGVEVRDVCKLDEGVRDGVEVGVVSGVVVSCLVEAADVSAALGEGCEVGVVGSGDGTEVGIDVAVVTGTRPAAEDAATQRLTPLSAANVTCSVPSAGHAWIIQSLIPFCRSGALPHMHKESPGAHPNLSDVIKTPSTHPSAHGDSCAPAWPIRSPAKSAATVTSIFPA